MTSQLIEQKESTLSTLGGSRAIIIPAAWLDKLSLEDDSIIIIRLCKGKKGLFFDGYKKKGR